MNSAARTGPRPAAVVLRPRIGPIAVDRRHADQRRDLLVAQHVRLGDFRQERHAEHRLDARYTLEEIVLLLPQRAGTHLGAQFTIQSVQAFIQPAQVFLDIGAEVVFERCTKSIVLSDPHTEDYHPGVVGRLLGWVALLAGGGPARRLAGYPPHAAAVAERIGPGQSGRRQRLDRGRAD
jgi:hypothetical protein